MGLEAATRQIALVVQLASVGHPLVDQDEARPVYISRRDACAPRKSLTHNLIHAHQRTRLCAGEQVVERQHQMGLATAEIGLKLYHRIATVASEPLYSTRQQVLQTLSEIGAAEEFDGVL